MLEVKNLSRYIGKKALLEEATFTLAKGKFLLALGPSGSGKTTLIRLLMGLDKPSNGSVVWRGRLLSHDSSAWIEPEHRGFGMVFQDPALFPHLLVEENVAFGLALSEDERKVRTNEWLKKFEIEHLARRRVQNLSGGERQRVALARSLILKPEVLLLDEPLSNVDRLKRHQLLKLLKSILREEQTTVILVTHDARDGLDLGADSVILLNSGRIVEHGEMNNVLREPKTAWAKEFLSCSLG
jgi:ABC-type Fe3+/spermidine/putrescine transport system ATPase subunit